MAGLPEALDALVEDTASLSLVADRGGPLGKLAGRTSALGRVRVACTGMRGVLGAARRAQVVVMVLGHVYPSDRSMGSGSWTTVSSSTVVVGTGVRIASPDAVSR